jgi:hypothetical protein
MKRGQDRQLTKDNYSIDEDELDELIDEDSAQNVYFVVIKTCKKNKLDLGIQKSFPRNFTNESVYTVFFKKLKKTKK